MTITKPTPPANLDPTVLHSPAERRAWQDSMADYRNEIARIERAEQAKAEAAKAHANRVLTDDDYFEQAKAREAAKQQKQAEAEKAKAAAEQAKRDYLASLPEVAEVLESNEFALLTTLRHWFQLGYEITGESITHFIHGCYAIKLKRPAEAAKAKKVH